MKRAIIGLIMLGLAGVAMADTIDYTNVGGDRLWSNAANWTNSVGAQVVPTSNDTVSVFGTTAATGLQIQTNNAQAAAMQVGQNYSKVGGVLITPGSDGHAAIVSGGTLTLTGQLNVSAQNNSATFENEGTLDVGSMQLYRGTLNFTNSGTIASSGTIYIGRRDASAFSNTGDITCGLLSLGNQTQNVTFNMDGGTVVGSRLDTMGGGAQMNLHGGTMTFNDVDIFDTGETWSGNYTMDVQNDGMLVVTKNMVSYLETAISSNWITGGPGLRVSLVDGDTIVDAPPPGTIMAIH